MSAEAPIRQVLDRIDAAWRAKAFDGLEQCFHPEATILGPGYVEYARGRLKCAESYREFATNAKVLEYSEDQHRLRVWESTAVYTFNWRMRYQREAGPKAENGSDQLVLQRGESGDWHVVFRFILFEPSEGAA